MEISEEISRTYGMQQASSHQVAESTLRLVGSEGLEEAEGLRQHRMTLWAVWAGDSQIRLRRSWETTENAKTMSLELLPKDSIIIARTHVGWFPGTNTRPY